MRLPSVLARACLALAVLLLAGVGHAERVARFEAEIYLGTDDDFQVFEKIHYDFEGESRHGIYRDIPVAYGRGRAADYRIRLEVESVTDADGRDRPYKIISRGRMRRIRIGDPDRKVSGRQDYWIRYRVERGYLYFESHDELYWNVNGLGWNVPFDAVQATVFLPEGGSSDGVEHTCFTGLEGSVLQDCSARMTPGALWFASSRRFAPNEGLTVVVGLPKGILTEPSAFARWWSRLSDYLSVWALLPLLALGGMAQLWRRSGRDRGASAAIPVRYEPPEGLSPAEVGTVVDERVDLSDITSTILDLAVRGYLRIEEIETDGFLFLKNQDYRLVRLRSPDERLRRHESLILDKLFGVGDEVLISSLKERFYRHLPELEEILYDEVSREGRYFPTSPHRVRTLWRGAGLVVGGAGVLAFMLDLGPTAAIPLGLTGLILFAFAGAMPRRTRRGRKLYEEIVGFQEFVGRVDRDRLERLGRTDPSLFEKALPYAIVLGVADAWAEAFADLYTQPPSWYSSAHPGGVFRPRVFVNDVGHSLDTMGQTLSSQPSQSGGGSGSSGFGGGGFSGGGFGGGGGGSW